MPLEIEQFICRGDNFCVLLHDKASGLTATIDAPQEGPILDALERMRWRLTHVLTTHWHGDHVEANVPLKQRFGVEITGPEAEKAKIPGIDRTVGDGDIFLFAGQPVHVIATPGHTAGHVCYHLPDAKVLLAGDTLFSLGCGRLFEMPARDMYSSLEKLAKLPDDTALYCGHEYTLANARFALTIDPDNEALKERAREVEALRAEGKPTLPSTMGREKRTNPFLRWADPAIRRTLGMEKAADWEVFAEIRRRKDAF
jgi:hydroxyacylglutathione hydrolase